MNLQIFEKRYYLGDLTDELEEFCSGSYIEEFVSGCPQNYAISVFSPSTGKGTTKCKVNAITLKYENSKLVNFTSEEHDSGRRQTIACTQS